MTSIGLLAAFAGRAYNLGEEGCVPQFTAHKR